MTDRKQRRKQILRCAQDDNLEGRSISRFLLFHAALFRCIAVRCNKAHLAYKLRKSNSFKLSCLQHFSLKVRRSPGIVLRGTIFGAVDAAGQQQIP
jgi:hypothetical protein